MAKILIIDDSADIRGFLSSFYITKGHDVVAMDNGKSGLKAFEKQLPDLIVVDMLMPIMGGREFLLNIRQMPNGANIPVIIISAYVSAKEIMDLLNMGATYFLKKPISINDLQEHLERMNLNKIK